MSGAQARTGRGVHATAVIVGERAVLIRGESGSGKSALALALMAHGAPDRFVSLVGDDRVSLSVCAGRVVVRAHPAIAGRIEQRGEGVLEVAYEPEAVVRAVADIEAAAGRDIPPRSPEACERIASIEGIAMPRLALPKGIAPEEAARRIVSFMRRLR